MSDFDLWLKACEEFNTKVYELEPGLYKTWNEYESKHNFYRTAPVYHVWVDGRRVYCGMSYQAAVRKATDLDIRRASDG